MGTAKRNTSAPLNGIVDSMVVGHRREVTIDGTFAGTYATGGDTATVREISGGQILEADFVEISSLTSDGLTWLDILISGTGKFKTFKVIATVRSTGAEVTNAVDLTAKKYKLRIRGA